MKGGGGEIATKIISYLWKMLFLLLMYTHKSYLLIWFKSLRILNVKLDIGKRRQRYAYTEGILQLYKNCIASSFLSPMRPNALVFFCMLVSIFWCFISIFRYASDLDKFISHEIDNFYHCETEFQYTVR